MPKSDNLLAVLWLLASRKRMTAAQLAEELELSVRTVYRYIEALCASGVPIVAEPGHEGGYSLIGRFVEAPLFFDEDERKAIVHAARFAEQAGYPHREALARALDKIRLYTNKDQLEALVRHTRGFDVVSPQMRPFAPGELLGQLEQAVADSRSIVVDYRKENGDTTAKRPIDPYGLVHWIGRWYIVAFCRLRGDIRSFRVDRIQAVEEAGETFERPPSFSAGDYFIKQLQPKPPDPNSLVRVVLEGAPDAIRQLCVNEFLQSALKEHSENRAVIEVDTAVMDRYFPAVLLCHGKAIRVVEPRSLQEALAARAKELAQYYESLLS